jgi:hypothetical protein
MTLPSVAELTSAPNPEYCSSGEHQTARESPIVQW